MALDCPSIKTATHCKGPTNQIRVPVPPDCWPGRSHRGERAAWWRPFPCSRRSTGVGNHPTKIVVALDRRPIAAEGQVRQQQQRSVLVVLTKLVRAVRNAAAELPVAGVPAGCRAEERVEGSRLVVISRRYKRAARAGAPVAGVELDAGQVGFKCRPVVGLVVIGAESWAGEEQ